MTVPAPICPDCIRPLQAHQEPGAWGCRRCGYRVVDSLAARNIPLEQWAALTGSRAAAPPYPGNISDHPGAELELLRALERAIRETRAAAKLPGTFAEKLATARVGTRRCDEILALLDLLREQRPQVDA